MELVILNTLTPKQRNAIKSIYLTDNSDGVVMGGPGIPQGLCRVSPAHRLQDVEAGYYTLGSCHGLRSLYINMDRRKDNFDSFHGPNDQFPFILMVGCKNLDALNSFCGLQNFHIVTSNHQQHPRSGDFPCCFEGKCLDDIDYFYHKMGIINQYDEEKNKRRWYWRMNLLEQEGKITFQSSN